MNNKKLNYSNKEVYLGIDVHRKKYVVCAVVKGEVLDTFSFSGSEEDFTEMLKKRYQSSELVKSCYEAGFSGFSLHRRLEGVGFSNSVVHAGAIEVSSIKKKTDKRDAKKMGLQLYSGTLKGIYIPTKAEEDSRRFIRLRRSLVKDRTRMRVRVRMLFNYYGILPHSQEGVLSYLQAQRIYVSNINNFSEGFKKEIGIYLDMWKLYTKQINELDKELKKQSEQSDIDSYYLSIPGIGLLTTRMLSLELGDMSRFKSAKSLYSYIGLTPSEFTSAESRRLGRISREGKPIIRALLIQAAWKAIKEDFHLADMYIRLKNKKGAKKAIVAVARKLAGIARSCVRDKVLYSKPVDEKERLAA